MFHKKIITKYFHIQKVNPIIAILYIILIFCTFFAYLGKYYWGFEFFSNFYIQYFFLSVFLAMYALIKKERGLLLLGCILLIIHSLHIFPEVHFKKYEIQNNETSYSFLSLNLQYRAKSPEKVIQYIQTNDPDIIGFLEYTPHWQQQLKSITTLYPYKVEHPIKGGFGIGLFSKYPLNNETIQFFGETSVMSIYSEIKLHDKIIPLIVSHPPPPAGKNRAAMRNSQLLNIAHTLKNKENAIFMGDFNLTPWSYYFKEILNISQLKDSRKGFGLQATWPSFMPLLFIPIDHFLYKGDITILQRNIGSSVGSDHFPVFVKIKLS
jgi:endonuclease/exonuclease/phosphatase (EEP) superfamily protein YafD